MRILLGFIPLDFFNIRATSPSPFLTCELFNKILFPERYTWEPPPKYATLTVNHLTAYNSVGLKTLPSRFQEFQYPIFQFVAILAA